MDQLSYLMMEYPIVKNIVVFMVICRLIFKPVFAILGKYVELSVEEEDNEKLHKFMQSKKYKMMVFIIDLIASVKMPKAKK